MRHSASWTSRRTAPWSTCLLLLCCLVASLPTRAAELLLSAEDSPAVRGFVNQLAERRPQDEVRFLPLDQLPPPDRLPGSSRLILLGEKALEWRLSSTSGPPTLALRISRIQARRLLGEKRPDGVTLLWSDPQPARQLRLARLLFPHAQRIGVLYDEHSAFLLDELRHAAAPLGLTVVGQPWPDQGDSRPLLSLLGDSDLLLGLDDQDLYNARTAKSLLLTSYTRQRALLGPSISFVRAGSLASSYSDQADWLATLDELLDQPPGHWPRAAYPAYYKVMGNRQVARALGMELASDSELEQQLVAGEKTQ